jgi:hypothetical protein
MFLRLGVAVGEGSQSPLEGVGLLAILFLPGILPVRILLEICHLFSMTRIPGWDLMEPLFLVLEDLRTSILVVVLEVLAVALAATSRLESMAAKSI